VDDELLVAEDLGFRLDHDVGEQLAFAPQGDPPALVR